MLQNCYKNYLLTFNSPLSDETGENFVNIESLVIF
nr:MAG TPA: hypothetical protein [Caudoviricetes sp.]